MEPVKYWLSILPHVYCVQKNGKALLYNTQNGENIHIQNVQVIDFLEQMHDRKNLGVIDIDETTYMQIGDFIKESVSKKIGAITEIVDGQPKPVQLMPILNLQRDVEKLQNEEGRSLGEDVLHYLSDVTIYLNNTCNLDCQDCKNYFNQLFHCTQSDTTKYLDFELLKQFLKSLSFTFIRRLAITGGNIFLYPHFTELITFLQKEGIKPMFGIHYGNIDFTKIEILNDFPLEIFVTFPLENNFINKIVSLFNQKNVKVIFEIISEDNYSQAEALISEYTLGNYDFKPFYNEVNQNFFRDNMYLTQEDILSDTVSQRIIFARQKLNTNFFGKIHLFPNGDIKAHPLKAVLGNCKHDTLVKIIENEMRTNTAWRVIRNQCPCNECIYQFLCPSPSDYEWVMGQNNLCNINFYDV
jgi:pseudo-rSAM protein